MFKTLQEIIFLKSIFIYMYTHTYFLFLFTLYYISTLLSEIILFV